MSWIFSKAMMEHCESLRCSQALVAEYLGENSSDGEQYAQLNVMPTPHKFWRNDKTMEFCDLSRFGLTLRLLTESHGEELLTLYLEDFHVRTFPALEKVQDSKGSEADYGQNLHGLLAKFDPATCSLKTAQCLLSEDSAEFCVTLPRSGTMQNGCVYPLTIAKRRTSATGSGLWPTPSVTTTGGPTGLGGGSGNKKKLEKMGMSAMATGRLNPRWTEWLMGWPCGWTKLTPLSSDALAMDKFQEWLQQHSISYRGDE